MKTERLRKFLKRLRFIRRPDKADHRPSRSDPDTLKLLVRGIMTTRPDEIGCDEFFEQLDQFAEMVLVGKSAAEALPLVQDHLDRCDCCHEEFEALLAALHALS